MTEIDEAWVAAGCEAVDRLDWYNSTTAKIVRAVLEAALPMMVAAERAKWEAEHNEQ